MRKTKALVLLSGGLDSILAVKILKKQKIEVIGVTFKSYFFGTETAQKAAKNLKIPLKIVDFSKEHLKMVKSPKHGYGKSMNPCIDCHVLMLKKAKEIMKKQDFDFISTGEVVGERPMSQSRKTLELIEKESSLGGYLLRPLSAKLLKPTIQEERGFIDRDRLLDISGRSRKRQMKLAKIWKIKEYPTPAGGCLLTDLEFGKRLRKLFEKHSLCDGNDIELLKLGRHFFIGLVKIIIGRDEKENTKIENLTQSRDVLIEMKNYPGPLTLIKNYGKVRIPSEVLEKAQKLTQYHSTKARNRKNVEFKMILKIDRKNFEEISKTTLKFLKDGKVVICPTDTVYGLICDATHKRAVEKLFRIKKRSKKKPVPIFVKDVKMAKKLAFINKEQERFLKRVWPGKVTVILKRKKGLLEFLFSNQKTIGLRIPDYKLITELLRKLNKPLVGTSANISGLPASTKVKEIISQFKNQRLQPDLIIDTQNLKKSQPSMVIDLTGKRPRILRKGDVKK